MKWHQINSQFSSAVLWNTDLNEWKVSLCWSWQIHLSFMVVAKFIYKYTLGELLTPLECTSPGHYNQHQTHSHPNSCTCHQTCTETRSSASKVYFNALKSHLYASQIHFPEVPTSAPLGPQWSLMSTFWNMKWNYQCWMNPNPNEM